MRRAVALWLVLFAAYAAMLGVHASRGERFTAAEAHVLLIADSIAHDHDVNLLNQYRGRKWRPWYHAAVRPPAGTTNGRLVEPPGVGFALLIAPAYGIGGPTLAQLWCAALVALGFVLAAGLGRRIVGDPWASWAALAVGLSPPVLGAATRISPELIGGTLLAGTALLALRARDEPTPRVGFGCAALIAVAPWLALELAIPATTIALALWHWLRRRQRGLSGFIALEVVLTSGVLYLTIDDRLFGGLTPYAAGPAGGPSGLHSAGDVLHRVPRLVGVLVDRDVGVLRWAPFLILALVGLWRLWTSHRDRLASALPGREDTEAAAKLMALVVLAVGAVVIVAGPALHGPWLAARHALPALPVAAALAAWGLHTAPRLGAALAAITLAGAVWLLVAAQFGDATLAPPSGGLPWAGLQRLLLPRFVSAASPGEIAWFVLTATGITALVMLDRRARRASVGAVADPGGGVAGNGRGPIGPQDL